MVACGVYHRRGILLYVRWKREIRGTWASVDELASISGSRNRCAQKEENSNRARPGATTRATATSYREVMMTIEKEMGCALL